MKMFVSKKDYKESHYDFWCGTFFGGWIDCCHVHRRFLFLLWSALMIIIGIGIGS